MGYLQKIRNKWECKEQLTPPRYIRVAGVALMSCTVTISSPIFVVAYYFYTLFLYMPKTIFGRYIKYTSASLITASMLMNDEVTKFIYESLTFLANHSDFVMPFAISNAVSASVWYLCADLIFKVPSTFIKNSKILSPLSRIPIRGPIIGVLTANTAPYLYPIAVKYCWSQDLQEIILGSIDNCELILCWCFGPYEWMLVPLGMNVGIFSGLFTQLYLSPILNKCHNGGQHGTNWTRIVLPMFAGISCIIVLYFTFCRTPVDDFIWYERINVKTGEFKSLKFKSYDMFKNNDEKLKKLLEFWRIRVFAEVFFYILLFTKKLKKKN
jgi:hypothetical protein